MKVGSPPIPLGILSRWADLGRAYHQAVAHRVPDWGAVQHLIAAAKPKLEADAQELKRLLEISNQRLHPLEDPLTVDLGLHRWLAGEREEAYSDWLQWVVENLPRPEQVFELFKIDAPADIHAWPAHRLVKREQITDHGHEDQSGRLDLVITFSQRARIVVEVKKSGADEADTVKHIGYVRSLKDGNYPEDQDHRILLATTGDDKIYGDFTLVLWEHLCVILRRLATSVEAKCKCVTWSMMLAFVGAVEQNLLGWDAKRIQQAIGGKTILRFPRILDHLDAALKESSHERPGQE